MNPRAGWSAETHRAVAHGVAVQSQITRDAPRSIRAAPPVLAAFLIVLAVFIAVICSDDRAARSVVLQLKPLVEVVLGRAPSPPVPITLVGAREDPDPMPAPEPEPEPMPVPEPQPALQDEL